MNLPLPSAAPRLPLTLKILPNLRWTGRLTLLSREAAGFVVEWDATTHDPETGATSSYVDDRCLLTPAQVKEWTGYEGMSRESLTTLERALLQRVLDRYPIKTEFLCGVPLATLHEALAGQPIYTSSIARVRDGLDHWRKP